MSLVRRREFRRGDARRPAFVTVTENGSSQGNIQPNVDRSELWKDVVAGVAGGLVASWLMNEFQEYWNDTRRAGQRPGPQSQKHESTDPAANPTVKTANAISRVLVNKPVPRGRQIAAGAAVHYAFGAAAGGLYGLAAGLNPNAGSGLGVPYGTAVWLLADEIGVSAAGLSRPPKEYPPSTHGYAFASHLVFGVTAELVRRAVRRLLR